MYLLVQKLFFFFFKYMFTCTFEKNGDNENLKKKKWKTDN